MCPLNSAHDGLRCVSVSGENRCPEIITGLTANVLKPVRKVVQVEKSGTKMTEDVNAQQVWSSIHNKGNVSPFD